MDWGEFLVYYAESSMKQNSMIEIFIHSFSTRLVLENNAIRFYSRMSRSPNLSTKSENSKRFESAQFFQYCI